VTRATGRRKTRLAEVLSERERECLVFLSRGFKVKELAGVMGTSPRTAEKQIASARRKLGASTREQAVATALMKGLLFAATDREATSFGGNPPLIDPGGDR